MAALTLVPDNAMPHADIVVSLGCEETRSVFILVHLHCSVRKGTTFLVSTLHNPIPHPVNRTRKREKKLPRSEPFDLPFSREKKEEMQKSPSSKRERLQESFKVIAENKSAKPYLRGLDNIVAL